MIVVKIHSMAFHPSCTGWSVIMMMAPPFPMVRLSVMKTMITVLRIYFDAKEVFASLLSCRILNQMLIIYTRNTSFPCPHPFQLQSCERRKFVTVAVKIHSMEDSPFLHRMVGDDDNGGATFLRGQIDGDEGPDHSVYPFLLQSCAKHRCVDYATRPGLLPLSGRYRPHNVYSEPHSSHDNGQCERVTTPQRTITRFLAGIIRWMLMTGEQSDSGSTHKQPDHQPFQSNCCQIVIPGC